ncbi:MAG: Hsp20/alpha crystallin family protein, partial [Cyanobacteria bacterium NC_groundwater_1444_Ag_S-0.65um_54_12]|nr:Hsp20/alpha crystallin family protein [Cyanobacteria bacterium NC_groundwater_1444_Ag_S-0.65um_54_12]
SQPFAPGFVGSFAPLDAVRTDLNRLFYGDPRNTDHLTGNLPIISYNHPLAGSTLQMMGAPYYGLPWVTQSPWVPSQAFFHPIHSEPGYANPQFGMVDPRYAPIGYPPSSTQLYSSLAPAMNVAETPDAHLLVVELPGVDIRDINLQVAGNQLILTAFRKAVWNNGTVTVAYHATEGHFGTLRRVFHLPPGYPAGQIQANFVNGQITIVLPKAGVPMGAAVPSTNVAINAAIPTTV